MKHMHQDPQVLTPSQHNRSMISISSHTRACLKIHRYFGYLIILSAFILLSPKQGRARPKVQFQVISIDRPLSRVDKRFVMNRRVVLFASRSPLPAELDLNQDDQTWIHQSYDVKRPLPYQVDEALLERQRINRINTAIADAKRHEKAHYDFLNSEAARFVRQRVKKHTEETQKKLAPAPVPTPKPQAQSSPNTSALSEYDPQRDRAEKAVASQMKAINEGLKTQDDAKIHSLIDGATPKADSPSTKVTPNTSNDQDFRRAEVATEPVSVSEGQICGQDGQPCCEQGFDDPCQSGLLCQTSKEPETRGTWLCTPPPPPCGGYNQMCCAGVELACPLEGLSCMSGQCDLPPLPRPIRLLSVGKIKILHVRDRFIEAEITADRLTGQGIYAVMKGDIVNP